MLVVGLSGGIGSGKSTVSKLLVQHNVPLVDLDILAREAVEPGSRALNQLTSHFGKSILRDDGSLNREQLGSIVFNDERQRRKLNSIVHPAVRRLLAWRLVKLWLTGHKLAVVDAPLLIEAGLWRFCGAIVIVYCSEALQVQRIKSRNNVSTEEAQSRIRAQAPLSSKLDYADYVIDNSGPIGDLDDQVDRVVRKLKAKAGYFYLASWLVPPVGILSALLTVAWRLGFEGVGKKRRSRYATRGERPPPNSGDQIELQERRRNTASKL